MKNLSYHADLPRDLLTSLLIRWIQMGEISKRGRLTELVKQAIWADSLYFLYLPLLSISKFLASSQPLQRHVGLILIFLEDRL
jgi:hypothetical protein